MPTVVVQHHLITLCYQLSQVTCGCVAPTNSVFCHAASSKFFRPPLPQPGSPPKLVSSRLFELRSGAGALCQCSGALQRITTRAECEQAAQDLGLSLKSFKATKRSDKDPPGCYFERGWGSSYYDIELNLNEAVGGSDCTQKHEILCKRPTVSPTFVPTGRLSSLTPTVQPTQPQYFWGAAGTFFLNLSLSSGNMPVYQKSNYDQYIMFSSSGWQIRNDLLTVGRLILSSYPADARCPDIAQWGSTTQMVTVACTGICESSLLSLPSGVLCVAMI